jgi:predicted aspartyl protease
VVNDPEGVSTVTCPEDTIGTVIVSDDALAAVAPANRPSMNTLSLARFGSNPLPLMVTDEPGATVVGEKLLTTGCTGALTTKLALLEAVPAGDVTATRLVAAPLGTVVVIEVAVTAVTVAAWLPKETVVLAVVPKPVPAIVTAVPATPADGDTLATTRAEAG